MTDKKLEIFGLQLSVGGTFFMSILGISFGLWIQSEAILLDGFFNVISFIMAVASLWVSWLVRKPASQQFQFDHLNFIPLVNIIKGLLIFTVSLFALISAAIAILGGGRTLNAGMAVVYAIIAASGCLIIALVQNRIGQRTNSAMVIVDSQNWLINGLISMSVGIAFGLVVLIKGTSFDWFIPYSDSAIVIILVVVTIPVPIKIILENVNQLLLGAPSSEIQKQLTTVLKTVVEDLPCTKYRLRMTQAAQYVYMHIFWLLPKQADSISVAEVDRIRTKITERLKKTYETLHVDIIFTEDRAWFEKINLPLRDNSLES